MQRFPLYVVTALSKLTLSSTTSPSLSTASLTLPTLPSNLLTLPPTLSLVSHTLVTLPTKPSLILARSFSSSSSSPYPNLPTVLFSVGGSLPSTKLLTVRTSGTRARKRARASSIGARSVRAALSAMESSFERAVSASECVASAEGWVMVRDIAGWGGAWSVVNLVCLTAIPVFVAFRAADAILSKYLGIRSLRPPLQSILQPFYAFSLISVSDRCIYLSRNASTKK